MKKKIKIQISDIW